MGLDAPLAGFPSGPGCPFFRKRLLNPASRPDIRVVEASLDGPSEGGSVEREQRKQRQGAEGQRMRLSGKASAIPGAIHSVTAASRSRTANRPPRRGVPSARRRRRSAGDGHARVDGGDEQSPFHTVREVLRALTLLRAAGELARRIGCLATPDRELGHSAP
jgi:hypothetical protein